MHFDEIAGRIGAMLPEELDRLPFGIIQLDDTGRILHYNDYESRLAGVPRDSAVGKNFFTEVAPCTDVKDFAGRFREGVAARKLDVRFRYRFDFKPRPRDVLVTLHYTDATASVWVIVQPLD